ncbi:MAG: hypothetical protein AAGI91_06120 [Bacteroidota bacterium]
MGARRPFFASVLLAITLVGGTLGPAAHWASHGLEEHEAPAAVPGDVGSAASGGEDDHAGTCLGCAHLQRVLGAEPAALPSFTGAAWFEQAVPAQEAPAFQHNVATPKERGPPAGA